jgi:hypothetical protein
MANIYLDESNIDDLGRMVTSLLSELWILRDRMQVMEELLGRQGILDSATIDAFDWTPEQAPRVEALRDQMIGAVLGAPLGSRERHVDQMLARAGYARPA